VLNGGGVAQLKTINVELTRAMAGHEEDIQGAIRQLDTFVGGLDADKSEVVRALDGLDRLSARLAAQKGDIATAIDNLGPGLKVLADQRAQLTRMLTALSDLGRVGTRVINASKADTLANLRALQPILTKLAEAGANLPGALEMLVTYPFPQAATGAVQGDFTNLRITADLDLRTILTNLTAGRTRGCRRCLLSPTRPGRCRRCRSPASRCPRSRCRSRSRPRPRPCRSRPTPAWPASASVHRPARPRAPTTPTWPG
jgi:phospholipid/cholesterol/gamma-HCH transport system substrate-binding protein